MAPSTAPRATIAPSDLLLGGDAAAGAVAIRFVRKGTLDDDLSRLDGAQKAFLKASGFDGAAGKHALVPSQDGSIACVVIGLPSAGEVDQSPLSLGALPQVLPAGDYVLATEPIDAELAALGWLLGAYRFERYRTGQPAGLRRLVLPEGCYRERLLATAEAVYLARDLINTPASDLGPAELEAAARELAARHGADVTSVVGDDLLTANFPMIHAVGRASVRAPRLVDIRWGRPGDPAVTLVGKGICFDTGGLDIKSADGMLLMKKDMGGAAAVLAAAHMIMSARLAVRLRVLLPIAENAISGNAFRPGDVLQSRQGMTVEIGNTDAEGRLVLADAMALAVEEKPEILVTFATLTGAARVALGPDLPPLYATDDGLAAELLTTGLEIDDPMWRMPFWMPYDKLLKSQIADVNHVSGGPMAGSVTAALFLKRFAEGAGSYTHLDIFGWTPKPKPGKPEGGEAQGVRALVEVLRRRYG